MKYVKLEEECIYCGETDECDCQICELCEELSSDLIDGYCERCDYIERGGDVKDWDDSQMFGIP